MAQNNIRQKCIMAQNGAEWRKQRQMAQNGAKWRKMTQNGAK